jgi:hypothetical protein
LDLVAFAISCLLRFKLEPNMIEMIPRKLGLRV